MPLKLGWAESSERIVDRMIRGDVHDSKVDQIEDARCETGIALAEPGAAVVPTGGSCMISSGIIHQYRRE